MTSSHVREAISDVPNPLGLDGIEFIQYATTKPQALGQLLEPMGFRPIARHRSRGVLLYRQGAINLIVNARVPALPDGGAPGDQPSIAAIAPRVRDAAGAYQRVVRSLQRWGRVRAGALSVQLGGAGGTLAQMQASGERVRALMAADLGLAAHAAVWHTQRDAWVALGCELGLLVHSTMKSANWPSCLRWGRGGSSAMPHKSNPVACMAPLAAAQRALQRVAALLAPMPQEHERALGNWQAELAEWPGLLMSAHGSAKVMAQMLPGLQVDGARMCANLDALRAAIPAEAADEWFDPALALQAASLASPRFASLNTALRALHPPLRAASIKEAASARSSAAPRRYAPHPPPSRSLNEPQRCRVLCRRHDQPPARAGRRLG